MGVAIVVDTSSFFVSSETTNSNVYSKHEFDAERKNLISNLPLNCLVLSTNAREACSLVLFDDKI